MSAAAATEQYLACFEAWLAADPDVLVLPTNGWGETREARFAHQAMLAEAGATRLAFVDPGATIFGWPDADGTPNPDGYVYAHNYGDMTYAIDEGARLGVGMHFACFEPGWLRNVMVYWRLGRLSPGSFVKFYFGGPGGVLMRGTGLTFGLPPTVLGLAAYREILALDGCTLPWFSAVVGGDLLRTPVACHRGARRASPCRSRGPHGRPRRRTSSSCARRSRSARKSAGRWPRPRKQSTCSACRSASHEH